MRQKYPCYIIAPTVGRNQRWAGAPLAALIELIKSSLKEHPIDPARIYVTGQSMGGFGTYSAILAEPHLFAAAVPVCGRGQPDQAKKIVHLPIWIFHGEKDSLIPPRHSREMVAALKKAGGKPIYTEYAGVGHGSWGPAYAEEKLWEWLFAQKRGAKVVLDDPEAKVIITDPIVEKAIRKRLRKPTGELAKADLEKVTTLSLGYSKLTDAGLKEVGKLQQLTSLDLSVCKQITDAGLMEVARLQQLTSLNLFFCKQITDSGLKEVAKLEKLTELALFATKITDAGLKEIAKLENLTKLGLKNTQVTDAGFKEIAKLENLTKLDLQNTQVTDAGLTDVAKLKNLKSLLLNGLQITDSSLKDIAKLKNLRGLFLRGTKLPSPV